jgi:hypothetical protein
MMTSTASGQDDSIAQRVIFRQSAMSLVLLLPKGSRPALGQHRIRRLTSGQRMRR